MNFDHGLEDVPNGFPARVQVGLLPRSSDLGAFRASFLFTRRYDDVYSQFLDGLGSVIRLDLQREQKRNGKKRQDGVSPFGILEVIAGRTACR